MSESRNIKHQSQISLTPSEECGVSSLIYRDEQGKMQVKHERRHQVGDTTYSVGVVWDDGRCGFVPRDCLEAEPFYLIEEDETTNKETFHLSEEDWTDIDDQVDREEITRRRDGLALKVRQQRWTTSLALVRAVIVPLAGFLVGSLLFKNSAFVFGVGLGWGWWLFSRGFDDTYERIVALTSTKAEFREFCEKYHLPTPKLWRPK